MGTTYRETYTKPLPTGAEQFTRSGERFARWTDRRGRKRTAKVTTGRDGSTRIVLACNTHTAKLRDGAGHVVKVATGCRTKDAADSVLTELNQRAEKVRSGVLTIAEDSVRDFQATQLAEHVTAYLEHLKGKRGKGAKAKVSPHHARNVEHVLNRVLTDCGFNRLRELDRRAVERWADDREADGMGPRTINSHLAALTAFGNWAVSKNRIALNPFVRMPKRDESADPRRERRALTEDELRRLLKVAQLRPLTEFGRRKVKAANAGERENKHSRKTWTRAALAFDDLDAAAERGREALRNHPRIIAKLARLGRERTLVYKTLALTGLRKGELAALTVGDVELTGPQPLITLRAAVDKAGRGATLPLRGDLAADLKQWLAERLKSRQGAAFASIGLLPARLPATEKLLDVPTGLVRIMDRDLLAAGMACMVTDESGKRRISKRDDRGRTVDVHALRHTFGTHLSRGGVSPRTAQAAMRHGSIDLTMNRYTDPQLLDVAGAMNVLPELPLNDSPNMQSERATGTYDGGEFTSRTLVPTLVPTFGKRRTPLAKADSFTATDDSDENAVSVCGDTSYALVPCGGTKRATRLERATFSLEG